MALLDLLGRRWTLRVLWELRDRSLSFRALQGECENVSPTVLNRRLKELREAGLVELAEGGGYGLTERGRDLVWQLVPLHRFAETWARNLSES
jgi:DNA-binding HxlR family transcriptional regulator